MFGGKKETASGLQNQTGEEGSAAEEAEGMDEGI